jgi:hypothetical protein
VGWVKLDDGFFRHPKVVRAGRDGRALYLAGLCWCSSQLSNGVTPAELLPLLAFDAGVPLDDAAVAADRLVEVGLWERVPEGWKVHDYEEHQRTREQVEHERELNRKRQQKKRSTVTPASRRDTPVSHGRVTLPESESESESDKNNLPKSSVSQGGVGGTTDGRTDGRVEAIADDIARRRHLAAVAAGEVKRTPAKHLESCRANALTELGDAIAAALDAGRDPGAIADDHAPPDPTASRSAAARARRNGAT